MRIVLLIITALATAYLTLLSMVLIECGNAGFVSQPIGLLSWTGSALLLISALIPSRVWWGTWVALGGCVACWIFFAPVVFYCIRDHEPLFVLIPPFLLLASTILVARSLLVRRSSNP